MAIAKDSALLPCPGTSHQVGLGTYPHNSFEADVGFLAKNQLVTLPATGLTYPPAGGWTWAGAGIAGTLSAITAASAPSGDFAAFLQSTTTTGPVGVSIPFAVPGPVGRTWRLDFRGALRWRYGLEGDDHQIVRVSVTMMTGAGPVTEVVFDETFRDDVYRTYLTRPFVAAAATITVTFQGMVQEDIPQTALIDLVEIREVLPWSSWTTWWGGVVPSGGTPVSIPVTSCVGVATGAADTIDLMGELLALESSQGALSTRLLHVHGAGSRFQVGGEGVPYLGEFEVVLDDDRIGSDAMINALMVEDGGEVAMHGRKCTSWLRLSATTNISPDHTLELESMPVGWRINDTIVIASSDRDWRHAERRNINGIAPGANGVATVTLDAALTWVHCGVAQPVQGPVGLVTLDQRAEVGLLTHNVKVRAQPRSTMSVPRLGGHIMISSVQGTLTNPGFGRFTGIELVNLGREKQVGRYPMHWHMLLDGGRGQYMKCCSIRDSNLRVVSVHGTDYVAFEDNVAHEHLGHGVFLEDGSEQWNVFRNNLVLGTKAPAVGKEVLPSDIKPLDAFQNRAPATFWITNPHNTFVGNVAAGGEGVGYWFVFAHEHMGMSRVGSASDYFGARTMPHDQSLVQFDDNVCHSTWIAFDVHDGIVLDDPFASDFNTIRTNYTWKPATGPVGAMQILQGFTAYACNVGIYTGDGDTNIVFDRAMLADSSRSLALASHDIVRNSVVVRDSGNNLRAPANIPNLPNNPYLNANDVTSALLLYDGAARLESVHLVGYDTGAGGAGGSSAFHGVGAARRRTNVSISGVTSSTTPLGPPTSPFWIAWQDFNAPGVPVYTNGDDARNPSFWAFSIDNPDLSLRRAAGVAHPTVVGNHPMMLLQPNVIEQPVPGAVIGPSGTAVAWSSPYRFAFLRVICTGVSGTPPNPQTVPPTPPSYAFQLRYTRERLVGTTTQALQYTDQWRTQFFKQMALAVNPTGQGDTVSYKLLWSDPSWTTPGVVLPPVELRFGEMRPGDWILVGFEGYGEQPGPASVRRATKFARRIDGVDGNDWQTMPESASMAALLGQTHTGWWAEWGTGILWIKVVCNTAGQYPAIGMAHDGLGQDIQVQR